MSQPSNDPQPEQPDVTDPASGTDWDPDNRREVMYQAVQRRLQEQ